MNEACRNQGNLDWTRQQPNQGKPGCVSCRHHQRPAAPKALRIYEAHVGMASEQEKVASYSDFTGEVHMPGDRPCL